MNLHVPVLTLMACCDLDLWPPESNQVQSV